MRPVARSPAATGSPRPAEVAGRLLRVASVASCRISAAELDRGGGDRVDLRNDAASQRLEVPHVPRVGEVEDDVLDADVGQAAETVETSEGVRRLKSIDWQIGALDLIERPAHLLAPLTQDRVLMGQLVGPAEDVAGVRVFGNEPKRLLLPAAAHR